MINAFKGLAVLLIIAGVAVSGAKPALAGPNTGIGTDSGTGSGLDINSSLLKGLRAF
jgi:hypothetical protein